MARNGAAFPIETRRAWTRSACAADPPLLTRSYAGGKVWGGVFRALPAAERARIAAKMAVGFELWRARKHGYPTPVIMTGIAEPDAEGGYRLRPDTVREMTSDEVKDLLK
jgi:hypothetical protein